MFVVILEPPIRQPLRVLASGSLGSRYRQSRALRRRNACRERTVARRQEELEGLRRSDSAGPRACARTVHSPPQSCASVAWIFRPSFLQRERASLQRVRANASNRHRTSLGPPIPIRQKSSSVLEIRSVLGKGVE